MLLKVIFSKTKYYKIKYKFLVHNCIKFSNCVKTVCVLFEKKAIKDYRSYNDVPIYNVILIK